MPPTNAPLNVLKEMAVPLILKNMLHANLLASAHFSSQLLLLLPPLLQVLDHLLPLLALRELILLQLVLVRINIIHSYTSFLTNPCIGASGSGSGTASATGSAASKTGAADSTRVNIAGAGLLGLIVAGLAL